MKILRNKELNAYSVQQDGSILFGFEDQAEEYCMEREFLTSGYHYEKGGEKYRALCEWIAANAQEGEKT